MNYIYNKTIEQKHKQTSFYKLNDNVNLAILCLTIQDRKGTQTQTSKPINNVHTHSDILVSKNRMKVDDQLLFIFSEFPSLNTWP